MALLALLVGSACQTQTPDEVILPVVGSTRFTCPDTRALSQLADAEAREFLFRYLCSDGRWHVHDDGALVADLRGTPHSVELAVDVRIRFGPRMRGTPPWQAEAIREGKMAFLRAGGERLVEFPLWDFDDASDCLGSFLLIRAGDVFVEIKEQSADRERRATREAIEHVVTVVDEVMSLPRTPDAVGYWQSVLPEGRLSGREGLIVVELDPGEYMILGRVNPGERGFVAVRLFDAETGEEFWGLESQMRRSEYVGWSKDDSVFFMFEVPFRMESCPAEAVRFEVWFSPRHERLLIEQALEIPR